MKIRLSIVIISYNTKQLLADCLKSFYKHLPTDFEVIVVDNNSADDSVGYLKKHFPRVKVLVNSQNLGYAKANNQGIKQAKGTHVLLLNSDTLASVPAFEKLLTFSHNHPQAGIISPQLRYSDQTIQQNGGSLPNLINIIFWQFFLDEIPLLTHLVTPYQQEDPEYYTYTQSTGWVSGASMLLTRDLINQIGMLDEKIFMYAEDIDYCYRAKQAGYQVWTVAETAIIHIAHGSGDKSRAILGEYKGLVYYFAKHHPSQYSMIRGTLILGAYMRAIILGRILKKQGAYETYTQAAEMVRHS